MDCLKRSPGTLNACTEARIEQHLRRHFKVPPGVRDKVYTMVTFEIDKQGRIGRLACTPKPHAAVEREVERVMRMLPEFVPASQSGHPVAVYFRIPLSVQVR
jgi:protein TonB